MKNEKFIDVGSILKRRRIELEKNLDYLSSELKISENILVKIEEGTDFELFKKIYYEGIVKKYCILLGIKYEKIFNYIGDEIKSLNDKDSKKFFELKAKSVNKKKSFSIKILLITSLISFLIIIINTKIKSNINQSNSDYILLDRR